MKVKYKNKTYKFHDSLPFKEAQKIIDGYKGKEQKEGKRWWYKKTDFGDYFLRKLQKRSVIVKLLRKIKYLRNYIKDDCLPEIHRREWYKFIPVLKNYFPTRREFDNMTHNARFLCGIHPNAVEDYYFLMYASLRGLSLLSADKIDKMNYKEFKMVYNYMMAENAVKKFLGGLKQEWKM